MVFDFPQAIVGNSNACSWLDSKTAIKQSKAKQKKKKKMSQFLWI